MPSRGELGVTGRDKRARRRPAADALREARAREVAGCLAEAAEGYEAAVAAAEEVGAPSVLGEALRRLAILRHHRDDSDEARALGRRSYAVARGIGDAHLSAEALNTLGCLDVSTGSLEDARNNFLRALDLGGQAIELRARVEQNLGVVANIQGELDEAFTRYGRSLDAYRSARNEHGCAIAYHNLGMVSADRQLWDDAHRYFSQSQEIAEREGDRHLQGLCLVNHAEVDVARQNFDEALERAERGLGIFDQLGTRGAKGDAYRVIGMVYRETGRTALAESRLRSALDLAASSDSVLNQAEASRELALLYQSMGRNQEALTLLNAAYRLFRRVDARVDLVHVGGKVADLESTYLALVRAWGQSIESRDSYTFGHCERVAQNAVAVAADLGLDDLARTTIRLGAYLHDVGKVSVPHEILNKPGPLTSDEVEVMQNHTLWGLELLGNVEFPWDLKPIIRWHHERYDGSGYPDRLLGEEIPLAAQVVGIVDVYDALTTTRAYQPAFPPERALARMAELRAWWSPPVFAAFLKTITAPARPVPVGA